MNDIRLNVDETVIAVSTVRVHFFHHVHNTLVADFTVLQRWKNHMEVVGVFVNVEEHGTSITTTSRQRLYRCY